MTDLRKAAEMALVALDNTARSAVEQYVIEQQVVTFLKQALAQNPLDIADRAYFAGKKDGIEETLAQGEPTYSDIVSDGGLDPRNQFDAQPEQEPTPVGMTCKVWTHGCALFDGIDLPNETLLYTAPPSKPWQSLTDEERKGIREWQRIQEELGPVWAPMMLYLYEAIEAALRSKNT